MTTTLKTVRYAGEVLELFTPCRPSWRLSQIAEALGLPSSSTHALVSSLVEVGLLISPSRGLYEVGWEVLRLASLLRKEEELVAAAEPVLARLSATVGVDAQLAVLERWRAHCLYIQPHRSGVARVLLPAPGESFTAHTSAAGKALLSAVPFGMVRQFIHVLSSSADPEAKPVNLRILARELDDVREHGYSVDPGDHVDGLCCLAAPVRTSTVDGLVSVSAVVPALRFERIRADVKRAVLDASQQLTGLLDNLG